MKDQIEAFLRAYKGRLKPSTLADYASILRHHLREFQSIDQANKGGLEDYLSTLEISGKRKNNIVSAVQTFVQWAARREVWEGRWMKIPRYRTEKRRIRPLDPEEARLLINHSLWPYRDFFAVSILTGIRTGEALALQFRDVDRRRGTIRIERAFSRGQIGPPKTYRGREVPLTQEIESIFLRRCADNERASKWFFFSESPRGGIMSYSAIRRAWKKHLRFFGIEARPLYATRHTFASLALAAGEDPLWVAQVLGHSRPDQLFLSYASYLKGVKEDGRKLYELVRQEARPALGLVK